MRATVLTATKASTTIVFRLYGDVSPERAAREERILAHRVEQLSR